MNHCKLGVLIPFILLLAGCGAMPRTPDLLVENAKGGSAFSEKDSFVVNQPLGDVASVLKRKAHECLQKDVSFNAMGDGNGGIRMQRREVRRLTPKISINGQRARLTLQVLATQGSRDVGDLPPDGWYLLVVDATAEGASKTKVDAYYQHTQFHEAFVAIKPWVTGANMACPDLTK